MRLRDVAVAAVLVAAAACGGGGEADDAATPTSSPATTEPEESTSSTTTTTTGAIDPTVIPDDPEDIDEAYVEAVLAEHNRVIGDALRLQLEGADLKEIIDRYNAVFVPEVADGLLTSIFGVTDEQLANVRRPPGDRQTNVLALESAGQECVEALVEQDFSEVLIEPAAPVRDVVIIRMKGEVTGGDDLNQTDWISEGSVPEASAGGLTC